jgi:type III secretory pathway component EscT
MSAIARLARTANRPAQSIAVLALCLSAPMALSLTLASIGFGAV